MSTNNNWTHLDPKGNPTMVGVGDKTVTKRMARAQARVRFPKDVAEQLALHEGELHTTKGAVFQTAIIAGVMAAKKTGDFIPLCHPLGLEHCEVRIVVEHRTDVVIECRVSITAKTGVEMEALTGASVAALTVYDMCKAFSHDIIITDIQLLEKRGGKRDVVRAATHQGAAKE